MHKKLSARMGQNAVLEDLHRQRMSHSVEKKRIKMCFLGFMKILNLLLEGSCNIRRTIRMANDGNLGLGGEQGLHILLANATQILFSDLANFLEKKNPE